MVTGWHWLNIFKFISQVYLCNESVQKWNEQLRPFNKPEIWSPGSCHLLDLAHHPCKGRNRCVLTHRVNNRWCGRVTFVCIRSESCIENTIHFKYSRHYTPSWLQYSVLPKCIWAMLHFRVVNRKWTNFHSLPALQLVQLNKPFIASHWPYFMDGVSLVRLYHS